MKPSIGLLGANGAGKTTIADYLVAEHGYRKLSFAEPLRELARLNETWRLQEEDFGYDLAKEHVRGFRQYLIDLGEGIRKVDPVYFVKALAQRITDMDPDKPWVVDDVRKQVEVNFLNDMGFRFMHVVRDYKWRATELEVPLTGVVLPTRAEVVLTYENEDWYKAKLNTLLQHAAWTLGGESADGSALVHEQRPAEESGGGSPVGGEGEDVPHWCARCEQEWTPELDCPANREARARWHADESRRHRDAGSGFGDTPAVRDEQGDAVRGDSPGSSNVVVNPSHWPGDVRPGRV